MSDDLDRTSDRWPALLSFWFVGLAGSYTTVILPLLVGSVAERYHLLAAEAGLIASVEMLGIGLGALLIVLNMARIAPMRAVLVASLLALAGNVTGALVDGFHLLLVTRLIAGMAEGGMVAMMSAAIGSTRNPDRNFAIFVSIAFLSAAASFLLLSPLVSRHGPKVILAVLGLLSLGSAAVAPKFKRQPDFADASTRSVWQIPGLLLSIVAVLAFFGGVGSVWPYMERIGSAAGASHSTVARTLALSSTTALAGALSVALVGSRFGRSLPLAIGIVLIIFSLATIGIARDRVTFSIAPLIFLFGWNICLPFILSGLAQVDQSGRLVALSITLQSIGFSAGPLLSALVLARIGVFSVVWIGVVGCAASYFLFRKIFTPAVGTYSYLEDTPRGAGR